MEDILSMICATVLLIAAIVGCLVWYITYAKTYKQDLIDLKEEQKNTQKVLKAIAEKLEK